MSLFAQCRNKNTKYVTKRYIDIAYTDREKAKKLLARWDNKLKSWYINTEEVDYDTFMTKFTGKTKKERRLDDLRQERADLCRSISHSNNADITIPDPVYTAKLKKELEEFDKLHCAEFNK